MIDAFTHRELVCVELGLALVTVLALLFIAAPYGRHARGGWGPTLPNHWGWVFMESPTLLLFVPLYFLGSHANAPGSLWLLGLWLVHYIHRTLIYPFRIRTKSKSIPLLVVTLGAGFQVLNAFVLAPQLSQFGAYGSDWLVDPRFIVGTLIFAGGFFINRDADRTLRNLRRPGETGYEIPRGRLYELVSCPNYLGEIVQWIGFGIATWSLAGAAFALYTIANVAPRALAHHRWYFETFPNYPTGRRALVPYLF